MNYIEILFEKFKTQDGIAKALGISQPAVGYWIKGGFKPSPINAVKIEEVTNGLVRREHIRPDVFGRI